MESLQDLYLKTAVLAGEILIQSNAEAYRVEETVTLILNKASFVRCNVIALTTGLYISVEIDSNEPITLIRRIKNRNINLYKIALVNDTSRQIINEKINIEDAYQRLLNLKCSEYKKYTQDIATFLFILAILLLFKGSLEDVLFNIPSALTVCIMLYFFKKYGINVFITDFITSIFIAIVVTIMSLISPVQIQTDLLIISCIMPLVPGTALTNGIRDMFRGDYTSGFAKLLESVMIALFIALGIASGLTFINEVIKWLF